jgi:hypothetical protein
VEPGIIFHCGKCKGELVVPAHNPEPDGVRRDQLSCTKEGRLGLTKLEGTDRPTTISSPQLRHSSGTCKHTTCMHAPEIVGQLPGAPLPTPRRATRPPRARPPRAARPTPRRATCPPRARPRRAARPTPPRPVPPHAWPSLCGCSVRPTPSGTQYAFSES